MPILTTLEKVKSYIGIKVSTAKDDEITDLIAEAKKDIKTSGVDLIFIVETDVLIMRAIKFYCLANYDKNDPRSGPCEKAYSALVIHLALSGDYHVV